MYSGVLYPNIPYPICTVEYRTPISNPALYCVSAASTISSSFRALDLLREACLLLRMQAMEKSRTESMPLLDPESERYTHIWLQGPIRAGPTLNGDQPLTPSRISRNQSYSQNVQGNRFCNVSYETCDARQVNLAQCCKLQNARFSSISVC